MQITQKMMRFGKGWYRDVIDVHSHVLPQVDDGSSSMEETIGMLSLVYEQGIRTVFATPHYHQGRHQYSKTELYETLETVREAIKDELPGLFLLLGQEILYFDGICDALKAGEALTMGDSRAVLVEFRCADSWNAIFQGVRKLLYARYIPIIAHAERYQALREPGRLEELIQAGAVIQMNYSSLEGNFWNKDTHWCRKQVLEGRIHLLGTDAHNMGSRKPDLSGAMKWLDKKCPAGLVQAMTEIAARKLLLSQK